VSDKLVAEAAILGREYDVTAIVRDTRSMISGMSPELQQGAFVFCSTTDQTRVAACAPKAVGMFVEAEGVSFILPEADAAAFGFDCTTPMRQITLRVYSALDGVGLTAAVSGELARLNIPCNVVAAYHHDHVFVPGAMADRAMEALSAMQAT
jgi:hypothetical protein